METNHDNATSRCMPRWQRVARFRQNNRAGHIILRGFATQHAPRLFFSAAHARPGRATLRIFPVRFRARHSCWHSSR